MLWVHEWIIYISKQLEARLSSLKDVTISE